VKQNQKNTTWGCLLECAVDLVSVAMGTGWKMGRLPRVHVVAPAVAPAATRAAARAAVCAAARAAVCAAAGAAARAATRAATTRRCQKTIE
jgi:hypothetical protein